MCCCSGPTCRAARRGAYRSSRPRPSTYAPVEPDSLIETQKILGKKAPSLTPIGNFHFILATRFSISHSSSHSSISCWCTGVLVVVSSFPTFKFQLFKHQVFFPSRGFLAALFLCSKPVLWFNARRSSIFIFFRRRVLVRNGGKGCLHRGGGDETRRTQHAPVVEHERRRRSQTGQSETRGRRAEPKHPPTAPRDSLTHSLTHSSSGVWKRRHCDCVFEEERRDTNPDERGDARGGARVYSSCGPKLT